MPKRESQEQKSEISWRAAEYQYVKKDVGWYFILVLIALVLIIISLTQNNFFFAVFVVFATIMLVFFAKRRPQVFDFRINDKGVAIGDKVFYDYERLEGFALRNRPERLDEVIIKKKSNLNPYIKIPIDSDLALKAKSILEGKLPEIEYQESLIEVVSEWFGF